MNIFAFATFSARLEETAFSPRKPAAFTFDAVHNLNCSISTPFRLDIVQFILYSIKFLPRFCVHSLITKLSFSRQIGIHLAFSVFSYNPWSSVRYILPTQYYSINTAKLIGLQYAPFFASNRRKYLLSFEKRGSFFGTTSQFKVFKPVCHSDAIIVNKLNMHEAP